MATMFDVGTRVRHVGRQWSDDAFATVLEAKPQSDGTTEYRVMVDADAKWGATDLPRETWWPSYYTRRGVLTVAERDECCSRHSLECNDIAAICCAACPTWAERDASRIAPPDPDLSTLWRDEGDGSWRVKDVEGNVRRWPEDYAPADGAPSGRLTLLPPDTVWPDTARP